MPPSFYQLEPVTLGKGVSLLTQRKVKAFGEHTASSATEEMGWDGEVRAERGGEVGAAR